MPVTKKPTKSSQSRKWSTKYKKSINCSKPKGFSQKQYCKYGRKKKSRRKSPKKSRRKSPKKSRRKSPKKSRRKVPKKSRRGPYKKRKTAAEEEIDLMDVTADGNGGIQALFEQLSILPNPTDGSGGGGASAPDASVKTVTGDINDSDKELEALFNSFNELSTNSSRSDRSDSKRISEAIKKLDKDKAAASSLLAQLNKTREDIAKSACTFSTISSKYIKKIKATKSQWEQVKQAAEEMNNSASKGKISMQALQNATSVIKEADNVLNKLEKMKEEANKACAEKNRSDAKPVGRRSFRSPKQKDPDAAIKKQKAKDKLRRREIKDKQRAIRLSNPQKVTNLVDQELALLMGAKGDLTPQGACKLPGVQQSIGPGRMRSTKAIANINRVLYNNRRADGGAAEIEMEDLEDRLQHEMDEAQHAQEVAKSMMDASASVSDSDSD